MFFFCASSQKTSKTKNKIFLRLQIIFTSLNQYKRDLRFKKNAASLELILTVVVWRASFTIDQN